MNIAILSFKALNRKATREEIRLKEEAAKRGHKVRIVRSERFGMYFDDELKLLYKHREDISKIDVLIPRVSLTQHISTLSAVLKQAELLGIPVLNGFYPTIRAKSKLLTLQMLRRYGVPIVKTVVIQNEEYLADALKYIETPLILKTAHGSYGKGVMLAETVRATKAAYHMIAGSEDMILIQEYISESKGKDLRAFVVGNKVVASMERAARRGEFRSNIELGGQGTAVELTKELKIMAIKATKCLGLEIAGVDIIITKHGPAVMEVNANPGFKMLEEVTKVNVAEKIIRHAERFASQYIRNLEI